MKLLKCVLVVVLSLYSSINLAAPDSEVLKKVLEAQPKCQSFVRYDDQNLYLGFGAYLAGIINGPREPVPGVLRVVPLDGSKSFDLAIKDSPVDLVSVGNKIYLLTYTSLLEIDLSSKKIIAEYRPYIYSGSLEYKEHAEGMARYKNKLIIAHGRMGISIFDMDKKIIRTQIRLNQGQLPLESMAVAVTVEGKKAFIVMDSFSLVPSGEKPPFQGIVTFDLDNEKVLNELDGMAPGADAVVSDGSKLIVSFMGQPLWKYSLADFKGTSLPEIELPIWSFGEKGHPTGSPAMDSKYYYTCFSKPPAEPGTGAMYTKSPVALSRKVLILD